jgi:rhodanese-related sulfurtransferase
MPVQTISPQDVFVKRGGDRPPPQIIDVRTPAEYAEVHAESARLVPLDRLDPAAVMTARPCAADEPLYVICKSGGRAAKACEQFQAAGFANVVSIEGGTAAWERAGLPVVRGTSRRVISLERQVRIGAGSLVLLGLALGRFVHPVCYLLSAFIGAGLVFAGATDWCGMGMLLARMPWNNRGGGADACSR